MDTAYQHIAALIQDYYDLLLSVPNEIQQSTYDIRLKRGQPVTICTRSGGYFIKQEGGVTKNYDGAVVICTDDMIERVFLHICGHSVFRHEEEIRNGFVSVTDTYRVGVCGTAVVENSSIQTIREVASLVFRIPRSKRGSSKGLFDANIDFHRGVLLAGEPASGKTTLLRDLVAALSFGWYGKAMRLSVLDERFELQGKANLGPFADVLRGYPKEAGIQIALRTLSPELIVCDELSPNDLTLVQQCAFSGVPLIATIHAGIQDIIHGKAIKDLLRSRAFCTVVCLKGRERPSEIERIFTVGENNEINGCDSYNDLRVYAWDVANSKNKNKSGDVA